MTFNTKQEMMLSGDSVLGRMQEPDWSKKHQKYGRTHMHRYVHTFKTLHSLFLEVLLGAM